MFHYRTRRVLATLALLSTAALPLTAMSASYLDIQPKLERTAYTASLAEMTQGDPSRTTRVLDWRQPSLNLFFDLPPAERTSEIVLNLSADPLTRVNSRAPLTVQFNNGDPVPVRSNGRGFEATLTFDPAKSRQTRNSIRLTFPAPDGADCVTPAHGQWSVDLAASTLNIKGRAKSRNMSLAEVETRLKTPALAPRRVGLIARGALATDMQALAAQGIALRTPDVPRFSVTSQATDFNIRMVRRSRLFDITNDPMILNSKGARIFVPKGRPTELIFTADTDAEVLHMLEIFSTRRLPNTRRPITSLGEIDLEARLDANTVRVDRTARLNTLGGGQSFDALGAESWASGAQTYRFGVADPVGTSGEVLLRLSATDAVAPNSRVKVALNGKMLGATKLDAKRKSVAFTIKPGALNASHNVLTVLPDLAAKPGYSCPSSNAGRPNFTLGDGSKLTLRTDTPTPITELSRLTATGGIFATAESYVSLPRGTRDYEASLRVLGRLAKSAGQGLSLADYTRKAEIGTDAHLLVIGPADMAASHAGKAPQALQDALRGQAGSGDNLLNAEIERFASAGADDLAVQMASARMEPRTLRRGGVAALYGSGQGRMTGVISVAPGTSFTASMDQLVQPAHWNALQGGVARWDGKSVLMAQTAQPAPGVALPETGRGLSLPAIGLPDFTWPDFDMPQVSLPDWSMPEFEWPELSLPKFGHDKAAPELVAPTVPATDATSVQQRMARVTPRLKPRLEPVAPRKMAEAGLRGPFVMDQPKAPAIGSYADLRRATRDKWFATKRWVAEKRSSSASIKTLDDVRTATDRLQDRVKPVGSGLRRKMADLPGTGVIKVADREFTVFGLMLILAFGLVLLMFTFGAENRSEGSY